MTTDDVVHVPGQLPLFPEPGRPAAPPVRRPGGGLYRTTRVAEPVLLGREDEVDGVAVMRTHDVALARRLALRALQASDSHVGWELTAPRCAWGTWGAEGSDGEESWAEHTDGRTGTPAVFFVADPVELR